MRIVLIAVLLLTGCTAHVPIGCPRPNIPSEPRYPVADLRQGDGADKVAKAYVATVQGQNDYIQNFKHIVGARE